MDNLANLKSDIGKIDIDQLAELDSDIRICFCWFKEIGIW